MYYFHCKPNLMGIFVKRYKAAGEEGAMTPPPPSTTDSSAASDHFSTASPGTRMSKLRGGGAGPDAALFGVST